TQREKCRYTIPLARRPPRAGSGSHARTKAAPAIAAPAIRIFFTGPLLMPSTHCSGSQSVTDPCTGGGVGRCGSCRRSGRTSCVLSFVVGCWVERGERAGAPIGCATCVQVHGGGVNGGERRCCVHLIYAQLGPSWMRVNGVVRSPFSL